MKHIKTNAMRILDSLNIKYSAYMYEPDGDVDAISVAQKIGKSVHEVYKTLVTEGVKSSYFVFVIPADKELNLKKAAAAVGQKSVSMLPVNKLNAVTGYIRGGCSPIGMKKYHTTVLDESCLNLTTMVVSAGKIGHQVELAPSDLLNATCGYATDVCN